MDVIEALNLEIRAHELDPDCSFDWSLRENRIPNLTEEVLDNNAHGISPGVELSDADLTAIVKRSWRTLLDGYDRAYETSRNMRKLAYALASLNNPFLIGREAEVVRISAIIGVEPREYVANRRQFIVDDLTKRFVVGAQASRARALAMICNDYAFELGLADHCIRLIERFGYADRRTKRLAQYEDG